jgi:hypothetical protein
MVARLLEVIRRMQAACAHHAVMSIEGARNTVKRQASRCLDYQHPDRRGAGAALFVTRSAKSTSRAIRNAIAMKLPPHGSTAATPVVNDRYSVAGVRWQALSCSKQSRLWPRSSAT